MRRLAAVFIAANILILITIRVIAEYIGETELGKNQLVRSRFTELKAELPIIAENPDKAVFFIGTSAWQYFLNPLHFDAALATHGIAKESYNFSFAGLIGPCLLAFTNRLQTELDGGKVAATFIEVSPAMFSREFYRRRGLELDLWIPEVFYSPGTWLSTFASDPPHAAYMFFNHMIKPFDWQFLSQVNEVLGPQKNVHRPIVFGVPGLWARLEYKEKHSWNRELRGLSNWNFPNTAAQFNADIETIHQEGEWNLLKNQLILNFGLNSSFAFDNRFVDMLIESIRSAQKFSKRTYVVIPPYAPSFQILVDQYVDYSYLKKKISDETGVEVIDLSRINLKDEECADLLHPLMPAMDKILAALADFVAPKLINQ